MIVGEVLEMKASGTDAATHLGLYPDKVNAIPDNVTGAIVPKTLFGEKYVSLEIPEGTSADAPSIKAGAVIDRSTLGTEVEKVLQDLYPLLRTIQPADLNMTLSALATALEGRGDDLGENLQVLDSYLKRMNPKIPALLEDLRLAGEMSEMYADILPEVANILDNTVKTTGTLEGREAKLNQLLRDVAAFSDTAGQFLANNGDLLVRFGNLSVQQLRVLAKYSPEFPCVTEGLVNANKLLSEAFRGYELHIVLEMLPNQPRKFTPGDVHRNGERRGPNCVTLPNPPFTGHGNNYRRQLPNFNDGVDEPTGKGTIRVQPGFSADPTAYTGSLADREVLRRLLADRYGEDAASDLGVALAAPLVAGGAR